MGTEFRATTPLGKGEGVENASITYFVRMYTDRKTKRGF